MNKLQVYLALNGLLVMIISTIGGLLLYRSILKKANIPDWHLLHSGGSARGIMLIALAAIIHLPVLTYWQLSTAVWLTLFFVWTSTLAMILRAFSGNTGFKWSDSNTNKLIYILYFWGTIAIFPAFLILVYGLIKALAVLE